MIGNSTSRAFTFIELLIVIVVLAIIAAAFLPPPSARGKALSIHCISNQRHVAIYALMYTDDFRKVFPNLDDKPGNDGPVALCLLSNYVKDTGMFMCPSVAERREKARKWNQQKFAPNFDASFCQSNGNDYAYYDGLAEKSAKNALLAERLAWTNRSVWMNAAASSSPFHPRGLITVTSCDGHAELVKADRVVGTNYNPAWSAMQDPLLRP